MLTTRVGTRQNLGSMLGPKKRHYLTRVDCTCFIVSWSPNTDAEDISNARYEEVLAKRSAEKVSQENDRLRKENARLRKQAEEQHIAEIGPKF